MFLIDALNAKHFIVVIAKIQAAIQRQILQFICKCHSDNLLHAKHSRICTIRHGVSYWLNFVKQFERTDKQTWLVIVSIVFGKTGPGQISYIQVKLREILKGYFSLIPFEFSLDGHLNVSIILLRPPSWSLQTLMGYEVALKITYESLLQSIYFGYGEKADI